MDSSPSYQQAEFAARRRRPRGGQAGVTDLTGTATWAQLLPNHRRTVLAKTLLLVAVGLYLTGGRLSDGRTAAAIVLSALLWAVLYAINEAYDLALEDGFAPPSGALGTLYTALAGTLAVAWMDSPRLALLFALMTAGQLAYCMPPVRLKRYWWPVLILSGVVNPLLRIGCGAIWGHVALPVLPVVVPLVMHVAATIRTRATQRGRDLRLGYRVAPRGIEWLGIVCTWLGIIGGGYLCVVGTYPRSFLVYAPFAIGFAFFAWSPRARSMGRLRKVWLPFAIASIYALVVLLRGHP